MKNLPYLVIFGTQNPDIICSMANSSITICCRAYYVRILCALPYLKLLLVKIEELILAFYNY